MDCVNVTLSPNSNCHDICHHLPPRWPIRDLERIKNFFATDARISRHKYTCNFERSPYLLQYCQKKIACILYFESCIARQPCTDKPAPWDFGNDTCASAPNPQLDSREPTSTENLVRSRNLAPSCRFWDSEKSKMSLLRLKFLPPSFRLGI